jgi:phosphorylcholine metabolism protein LicD
MKENLPEHLHYIESVDMSPYFYDNTIRIYDDRWLIREETDEDRAYKNYQNHIGTDVFIYSGCPGSKIGQKIYVLENKIFYGMLMAYRYQIDWKKYSPLQKAQVAVLRFLGRLYSGSTPDRLLKKRDSWVFRYDANKTGFRVSVNAPLLDHYMRPHKNDWFFPVVNAEIRGHSFPIENGYDNKLKTIYGDYMTPVRDTDKYIVHLETESN